jgi:hypothetical protein
MLHAWERGEKCTGFLVGKPDGKSPVGRPRRRVKDVIKWILGILDGRVWSGFTWLRIGTGGGLL